MTIVIILALREVPAMYKMKKELQITFFDFNQSCGMQLDPEDEWIRLADSIDWDAMEEGYAAMFPSNTGRPAKPFRMALGSLIIQKRLGLSDRALTKMLSENPYLQYFIGCARFLPKEPFRAASLVAFRKRMSCAFLMEANEIFLAGASATGEHPNDRDAAVKEEGGANLGTMILDATCSPSNIEYPQDFALIADARARLERMIDEIHEEYRPWPKPRTYRRVARKEYLEMAKSKKRPEKKMRKFIRKHLGYVKRDMGYVEEYASAGYPLPDKRVEEFATIAKLYEQQLYMYENHVHSVPDRIVSISQPYLRPIVRGKAKAKVEFGAKYDVSVDEKGHARLERISFDAYNESTVFQEAVERYKTRTGRYPERALVDQIYRTRENRRYCKEHGISISGPKLGRKPKDYKPGAQEKKDNVDRIEVERFFSVSKRCSGAGLIVTKLEETTLHSIALSVLVANMFMISAMPIFLLCFTDREDMDYGQHLMLFDAEL